MVLSHTLTVEMWDVTITRVSSKCCKLIVICDSFPGVADFFQNNVCDHNSLTSIIIGLWAHTLNHHVLPPIITAVAGFIFLV